MSGRLAAVEGVLAGLRPGDTLIRMYDSRRFTMAEIAASCDVAPMTVYRDIQTAPHHADRKVITGH